MSEEQEQQTTVQPVTPRKRRSTRIAQEAPPFISLMTAKDDQEDFEIISLHDNEDIPPTGQFFGVNGRAFQLRSNTWYKVPSWLLSSIDNCVVDRPVQDDQLRLIGVRPMKRFPYEIFRG